MLRLAGQRLLRPTLFAGQRYARSFRTTSPHLNAGPTKLNNILEGGPTPAVQVRGVTAAGIELEDGLILPSACVFIDGNVFLWNVPPTLWSSWGKEHFELFEIIVPKPGERAPCIQSAAQRMLTTGHLRTRNLDTWHRKKRGAPAAGTEDVSEQHWDTVGRHGYCACLSFVRGAPPADSIC